MMRRLHCLFSVVTLLAACSTEEERPQIGTTSDEVVLQGAAASEATVTVTATEPWEMSLTGSGFTAEPLSGERGETVLTLTATGENGTYDRRTLGRIELRLTRSHAQTALTVVQSPATAPRTVAMYLPWSGNLTRYFEQNIADMEGVVATGALHDDRVLVYFMPSATSAQLFELRHDNGTCVRRMIREYNTPPAFTTAEGIAAILAAIRETAPARRYAMTIGCHGMAWLPVAGAYYTPGRAAEREKEYWEYEREGVPLTRWFGGVEERHRTDIRTLADGITAAGMHMEYILFDDCYMSSVEVAYELRTVTDHLIGSTSEIMAFGFPYALMGHHLVGEVDYEGICNAFHGFYSTYQDPYGTIGVTVCAQLPALADVMRRINARYTFPASKTDELQALDGYSPVRFFDMGDYVRQLCADAALLSEFEEQLARTVPIHRHTPQYYSMSSGVHPIRTFSGITTSDPSISSATEPKTQTAWWAATH